MSVVVVLNPRSRANRRDPAMASRLASAVGAEGRIIAAPDLDRLASLIRELADGPPPEAVAIHGGDGTLHKSLSALVDAFPGRELPPIAILPGGTMNVVSASLGLGGRPEVILRRVVAAVRSGWPLPTVERHCLKIGNVYGFVFGNGFMANFLEEYYGTNGYGAGRAAWLLLRTFGSGIIGGPFARRMFRGFEGRVEVDGKRLPFPTVSGLGAATVREVGMGFKLNHRADEDPERFSVLAIHAGPVSLGLELAAVHQGRGISPDRAWSGLATSMRIEPRDMETVYTIDGDLYRSQGPIEISLGPTVRFVKLPG